MKTSMKRALLGTTAVVGLGLLIPAPVYAAEPVSLSVTGYARVEAWAIDQQDTTAGSQGFHMETDDAEIQWTFKGEADNGLKYMGRIEFDMDAAETDEIWLRFQGPWGQLELGDQDGAEDVMLHDGTAALTAQGGYDGGAGSAFSFNGVRASSPDLVGDTSDATKISYFTPRINSVQAGISFTPDTGQAYAAAFSGNDAGDRENSIGLGINIVQSYDDVSFKIGLVGVFADQENKLVLEKDSSWALGGNVSFGGFTIGASHGDNGDSQRPIGDGSDAGEYWEMAAGYSTGDLAFHVGYFAGEASNVTGTADDETRFFTLGVNYNVAPGLRVYAEFDDIDVDQPGTGAGVDNDGQLFMIGTNISF